MPAAGVAMLLWFRWRPGVPEHLAGVELVHPTGDYSGPDARTEPFYLAWCDCGWSGDDRQDEAGARADAHSHTQHVLPGLHAWDE